MPAMIPPPVLVVEWKAIGVSRSGLKSRLAETISVASLSGRTVLAARKVLPGELFATSLPRGFYLVRVESQPRALPWVRL